MNIQVMNLHILTICIFSLPFDDHIASTQKEMVCLHDVIPKRYEEPLSRLSLALHCFTGT